MTVFQSGDRCWLTDADGNRVLDGFAGLWCVNAGYGHESAVEAAAEQMRRLPYATGYFHFGTLGFAPAICITKDEIDLIVERVEQTLESVADIKE